MWVKVGSTWKCQEQKNKTAKCQNHSSNQSKSLNVALRKNHYTLPLIHYTNNLVPLVMFSRATHPSSNGSYRGMYNVPIPHNSITKVDSLLHDFPLFCFSLTGSWHLFWDPCINCLSSESDVMSWNEFIFR